MSADDTIRVRVDYDFASSLCYVAHRAMQRLAPRLRELRIELVWSPLDLTLISGWRRGAALDGERRANVLRVSAELGVPLAVPSVWLDSRRAHAVALSLSGPREESWREAVWSRLFEGGGACGDASLDGLERELGVELTEEELARRARELVERTRRAHQQEVFGVPSFMLGEWPYPGIQTDETMLSVLSRFAERRREAAA